MTLSSPKKVKPSFVRWRIRFRFLILAAAILHLGVAGAVLLVGRFGLMPSQFDRNGLAAFASDGYAYRPEILELCEVLKTQGVVAWATWPTQLHLRLYSLPLAALGSSSGFNILKIEPLNLIYYLAILGLLFKLGALVFNYRTGLIAAGTVALWPSFLLHTTQVLRDPLLITAFLVLMLTLVLCLKRDHTWIRGLLGGVAGAAAIVLIRIVRLPMWSMLWAITALAILFLIVQCLSRQRFLPGNILLVTMMIAALLITPRFQDAFHNQQVVKKQRLILPEEIQKLPVDEQIAARREGFKFQLDPEGAAVPSDAGSDIDQGVRFNSTADIVRHVPRAMVVGFFAPFPNMWFGAGKQVGGSGRLLSGFETLLSYLIECLALFALWRQRRSLAAWFVFLVLTLGAIALGLVVSNIGALYRLRYPFWAMLIVFGAAGAGYIVRRRVGDASEGGFAPEKSPGTFHS